MYEADPDDPVRCTTRGVMPTVTHDQPVVPYPIGDFGTNKNKQQTEINMIERGNMSVALYVVVLIAVIVSTDLLFFKNRFWERLIANIGIVLLFAAFYLRFLKSP
jgi:hypothetical protein